MNHRESSGPQCSDTRLREWHSDSASVVQPHFMQLFEHAVPSRGLRLSDSSQTDGVQQRDLLCTMYYVGGCYPTDSCGPTQERGGTTRMHDPEHYHIK